MPCLHLVFVMTIDEKSVLRYDEERIKYCQKEIDTAKERIKNIRYRENDYKNRYAKSTVALIILTAMLIVSLIALFILWSTRDARGHWKFEGPNDLVGGSVGMGVYFVVIGFFFLEVMSIVWHIKNCKNKKYYFSRHDSQTKTYAQLYAEETSYIAKMHEEYLVAISNYEADRQRLMVDNVEKREREGNEHIDMSELLEQKDEAPSDGKAYFDEFFIDLSDKGRQNKTNKGINKR